MAQVKSNFTDLTEVIWIYWEIQESRIRAYYNLSLKNDIIKNRRKALSHSFLANEPYSTINVI